MISPQNGINTLEYEITNIEKFGFWFLVDNNEYFIPYEDYPVFKTASVEQILNVKRIGITQFHWEEIDADIELEALKSPDNYVLRYHP